MATENVATENVTTTKQTNGAAGAAVIKKASKLKAKDPQLAQPSKPKILEFGRAGVGKTWVSLDFPNVCYIDTEGGANREQYTEKLKASGGGYLGPEDGSRDPGTILEQIQALATEKHGYKTLVIDSISKIYNGMIAAEAERLGPEKDAFGASKKPAIAWTRKLVSWIDRLDMNVILVAHEMDEWGAGNIGKVGETFDAWNKLEFELDLTLRIVKQGKNRYAFIRKSRIASFVDGEKFDWSYAEFAKRYGKEVIERASTPITLATAQQVAQVKLLLEVIKVAQEDIEKWFSKAGVTDWPEMSTETIEKCIVHLKSKVS